MKKLVPSIALLILSLTCYSQSIQVKCTRVVEIHGQYAMIEGKEMNSDTLIKFNYRWRGGLTRPLKEYFLNQWFTIYPEGKRMKNNRIVHVTKNK